MGIKEFVQSFIRRFGYEIVKRKKFDKSYMPFFDDTKPSSNKFTQEVTQTILSFFDEVDPLYANVRGLGPLAIGGAWREDLLERRKNQLRILKDEREEKRREEYEQLLLNMYRNELISGLWSYGYYQTACRKKFLSNQFLNDLKGFEYVTGRNIDELPQISFLGNPWGLQTKNGIIKYNDPWHGIQADSVLNLLNVLARESSVLQKLTVIDLGSGFGGTIEKMARWNKYPTQYILIDIPMNLTTAYAYISFCFPESQRILVGNPSILIRAMNKHFQAVSFLFVPSLFVEEVKNVGRNVNVLLNAGSLSEMDYETIEFYLENLVTENTDFFIEWNSNAPVENTGGHIEITSSKFPIPSTHRLLCRNPVWRSYDGHRYLNSLWINSKFLETTEARRIKKDNK